MIKTKKNVETMTTLWRYLEHAIYTVCYKKNKHLYDWNIYIYEWIWNIFSLATSLLKKHFVPIDQTLNIFIQIQKRIIITKRTSNQNTNPSKKTFEIEIFNIEII